MDAIVNSGATLAANTLLTEMGKSISDYIKENAVVNFSWVGIDPIGPVPATPVPTPDPVITAKGKITLLSFNLTPSMNSTPIPHMQLELVAGMTLAMYNITDSGFSTIAMPVGPAAATLVLSFSGIDRPSTMLSLATSVVNWVKALKPIGIILGSHGKYLAPLGTGGMVTTIE